MFACRAQPAAVVFGGSNNLNPAFFELSKVAAFMVTQTSATPGCPLTELEHVRILSGRSRLS